MKKFLKDNSLNLASIVIATCAVFLTLYQAYSTNYHNRISLIPLVQAGFDITNDGKITLYFENAGNGPAIITGFESFGMKAVSVQQSIIDFLRKEKISDNDVYLLTTAFSERMIIKEGDKLNIAELYFKNNQTTDIKAKKTIDYIGSIPITICYISLYQDELYATSSQEYVLDDSCVYDGAVNILGSWIKFRMPFSSKVDQSELFAM
ncbi:TPA: hypothetical protein RVR74_001287 [Aeromonas salmonicida]|nr:hypothetical protein [Aeromonas salmonicida]